MIVYLIVISSFITTYLIFYSLFSIVFSSKRLVSIRLGNIARDSGKERDSELNKSLFSRTVQPFFDSLGKTVLKITPKEFKSMLEKKIIMAGSPNNLTVKDWINLQAVIILCLPAATTSLGYYIGLDVAIIILISIFEIVLGLILPSIILGKTIGDRQQKIIQSLPDVLDILTVSVEAGLGFDGALAKVIDKMPGPLADEFDKVLQEIKVGRQKKDALREMAERVNVQDLTTFISSVIQADQLGVSIGNVLRLQSEQIRQKRRQRAQEKAMKAPVKMLIPMVLFIFPTIFSVLIGPVIIRVINTFLK